MNHGPQCTSPAQPQHSRSVNHDRDSAHCSLHQPLSLLSCMLCSPRVPLQTRTLALQCCSCRGSSCCVMINEAMKHAPHLTVPRVHSVYTYRVSTNTHRAQPSGTVSSSSQCRYWRYHSLTHHGCCTQYSCCCDLFQVRAARARPRRRRWRSSPSGSPSWRRMTAARRSSWSGRRYSSNLR